MHTKEDTQCEGMEHSLRSRAAIKYILWSNTPHNKAETIENSTTQKEESRHRKIVKIE